MSPKKSSSEQASAATRSGLERHFILVAGILLATLVVTQIGSALQESPTNDEPVHLTIGYVYLTTGQYLMEQQQHPPLGRVLAALPLLTLPSRHVPPDQTWFTLGTVLWDNPPSAILLHARLVIIALTFLFGAWLSWWTRRQFGAAVALLALTFFCFDPNIIAHGHYVTTDLIASFGIFLACTLWTDFLQGPTFKALVLAVGALGLAFISKYSALFLLIVLPLLYGFAWRRKSGQLCFTMRGSIGVVLFTTLGALSCITLAYAPATLAGAHSPTVTDSRTLQLVSEVKSVVLMSSVLYIEGLNQLRQHESQGNPAYLLGKFGHSGWWQYFPIAFLVKTPTGILLACLFAAVSLLYVKRQPAPVLPILCLTLAPTIYFVSAILSSIDIGVRHILPVYPFLYVFLAFVLVRYGPSLLGRACPFLIAGLIVLTGLESLLSYPHYLAFFNWPSGGPAKGADYLLDSNLDWGQDTDNLKKYVQDTRSTPLCTALFGHPPPHYFGTGTPDFFTTSTPQGIGNLNCVAAVSVNFVKGLFVGPEAFALLRQREPSAKIGFSIYLYDLRH